MRDSTTTRSEKKMEQDGECYLEDLEDREKVLFQPVFEVPDKEILVIGIWMKQRLVTEISGEVVRPSAR